jgi:hypothetical protein
MKTIIIGLAFIAISTCEPGGTHMRRNVDYTERTATPLRTSGDKRRNSRDEDVTAYNVKFDKSDIEGMFDDF